MSIIKHKIKYKYIEIEKRRKKLRYIQAQIIELEEDIRHLKNLGRV